MFESIIAELKQNGNIKIVTDTGEVLKDVNSRGRERPWKGKKKQNIWVIDKFEKARKLDPYVISESRLEQVSDCANLLWFAEDKNFKLKLASASFCRHRICPMCNWRKSLKTFVNVKKIQGAIEAKKEVRYLFVTLTVKNVKGFELRSKIQEMNEAFKWIVQKGKNSAISKNFKKYLYGYFKTIEVTYNEKRDDYHPHFHILLEVDPKYFENGYTDYQTWRVMWQEVMHLDYQPQVDIKAVKEMEQEKAVAEISKYSIKMDSILHIKSDKKAVEVIATLKEQLQNLRMITMGGDFRYYNRLLNLDDIENGDLIHINTENQVSDAVALKLFKYNVGLGQYIC